VISGGIKRMDQAKSVLVAGTTAFAGHPRRWADIRNGRLQEEACQSNQLLRVVGH
jgi:hypothetical protein